MEQTPHHAVNIRPQCRSRGPYDKKYSRVTRHVDWYLHESLGKMPDENWTMEEIQTSLDTETGIKMTGDTIRKYNAQQFLRFETAPLNRVSDTQYALNSEYYRLMGDLVSEPGQAKLGRPRKSEYRKPPTRDVTVLTL